MDNSANVIKHTGWVKGPCSMGILGYIHYIAALHCVEVIHVERKQNIFIMEVAYTVRGPDRKIETFKAEVTSILSRFGALEQG